MVSHGGVTTDMLRTLLGDDELGARAPALIDDGVPSCAITTLHGMPATAANYTWVRDVSNGMFLNAYCLTLVLCRIWL